MASAQFSFVPTEEQRKQIEAIYRQRRREEQFVSQAEVIRDLVEESLQRRKKSGKSRGRGS